MTDLSQGMALSAAGLSAQSQRLRHVAENIANTDTPGYQRKSVSFSAGDDGRVEVGPVRLDRRDGPQVHDPAHPMAGADGTYEGSNVDLVLEIADAREAQRTYEANLRVFDQARQMTQQLYETLRR
jgi:flagellar basal-body rod protein FlgC